MFVRSEIQNTLTNAGWMAASLVAVGCATGQELQVAGDDDRLGAPDSGSGAGGDSGGAGAASGGKANGSGGGGAPGGAGSTGGSDAGVVADAGADDAGADPCIDPGMKRCGALCVEPSPALGCGLTDCDPCPTNPNYESICIANACSFDCPPGETPTETGCSTAGPHCDNGATDADETDLDCGGAECPECPDGSACVESGDCSSGRCDDSVCASCTDSVQNGAEVGIDCGGPCSLPCHCTNATLDGDETGLDCGGANCGPCFTRKKLTVVGDDATGAVGALTHFPVLVRLTDPDLQSSVDASGLDLHFTAADGTTPLPFERESYDSSTGTLVAWVALDLTGADQDFYIYYGDGDLTEKSTPGAVWDAEFEVVYHLSDLADSTSHGYDGTNRGSTVHAAGVIGGARDFDGNAEILGPRGVLPTGDDYWTVSYWGRADTNNSAGDNEQWAVSTQDFAEDGMTIGIETPAATYANGNMLSYVGGWRAWQNTILPDETWARVDARVFMNSSGYVEMRVDGGAWERKNLNTNRIRHTSRSYITVGGEEANTNENWLGQLDEVRISSTLRSDDWLTTEYHNQKPGSTFLTVGPEER